MRATKLSLLMFQSVKMTICQPRLNNISEEELSVSDLLAWAESELKPKAELAYNGEGDFAPDEYTCKFCRARQTCRARTEKNLEMARHDFKPPALLDDGEISEILAAATGISEWVKDVYAYSQDKAIREGKEWDGFKLVEGRSNRKYTDEIAVAEACEKNGFKDIYTQSLIGIKAMKKLLGKKFNDVLGKLIEKPKGKLTLTPISDKRQKINSTAEANFRGCHKKVDYC